MAAPGGSLSSKSATRVERRSIQSFFAPALQNRGDNHYLQSEAQGKRFALQRVSG